MLILNTYVSPINEKRFNIYIVIGITEWFTTFAVRYTYSKPHKLRTYYFSNWEVIQQVTAKDLVKVTKYETT